MSITLAQLHTLRGHGKVVTHRGEKVGTIGQIYLDDETGAPRWVTVKTGLFGTAETFVPVDSARLDGEDVVVTFAQETIEAAPRVDVDGSPSPEEERLLYRHYGIGTGEGADQETGRGRPSDRDGVRDAPSDLPDPSRVGPGRSGPTTDTAVTRSEERLRIGTQRVEVGRARLRKYVVTEQVTQTVPVRHEEVRLVREPITDADRGPAAPGLTLTEEEHEVVLHAEKPFVTKTVVPVERVRMGTTTVTSQETVSAEVRKEQIELDEQTRSESRRTGNTQTPR